MVWDWLVSLVHTATFRLLPRRAVSFGMVGISGMVVHVGLYALLRSAGVGFFGTQVVAVITAACSNYLINNSLTFAAAGCGALAGDWAAEIPAGVLPGMAANVGVSTVVFASLQGRQSR